MNLMIQPGALRGTVEHMMASKSQAHRLLICAAQTPEETWISNLPPSEDTEATLRCLEAMGTEIRKADRACLLKKGETPRKECLLDCGESGSTLRFLLPATAARGMSVSFTGRGKLASRPLSPLYEELQAHGAVLSPQGIFPLHVSGKLSGGMYRMTGGVSSQFFSGLLMALPLLPANSRLEAEGRLESEPYVDMTLNALRLFGIQTERTENTFFITGGQTFRSPGNIAVEADWSGAAFWLAAGALSDTGVTCRGLNTESAQGDRAILTLLQQFGAEVAAEGENVKVRRGCLHGIDIDASDIPDLVPVLAVTAACAEGDTRIRHIRRLRLKESDRVESVLALIRSLGGDGDSAEDEMIIHGSGGLRGGTADSFRDHRIAMAAAVAATAAGKPVNIIGAECVSKSYPGFFEQFEALEGRVLR